MNTAEILSCLKQDHRVSPYLVGVYPKNKLPHVKSLPCAIVANTDTSNGPGEHWIAIYWPIEGEPLYFVVDPHAQEIVLHVEQVGKRLHQVAGGCVVELFNDSRSWRLGESQLGEVDLRDSHLHRRPSCLCCQRRLHHHRP